MTKFVFAMLLVLTSGGVGLALISSWLHRKLEALDHDETHKALIVIRLGMAVTNGVLIYAIGIAGPDLPVNIRSWIYIAGIMLMTGGFWWEVKVNIGRLAVIENELEQKKHEERLSSLESRVTAEEARNTEIEAQATKDRRE